MLRVLDAPPDKGALRAQAMKFSAENSVAGYEQLISKLTEGRCAGVTEPQGLLETPYGF